MPCFAARPCPLDFAFLLPCGTRSTILPPFHRQAVCFSSAHAALSHMVWSSSLPPADGSLWPESKSGNTSKGQPVSRRCANTTYLSSPHLHNRPNQRNFLCVWLIVSRNWTNCLTISALCPPSTK